MGIFKEYPFPLGNPMAKELLRTMARVYRSEDESIRFVAQYGIDVIDLKPGLSPIDRWQDLLDRLAKKGKLRAAVKQTYEENRDAAFASFLDALLADRPLPVSAEPLRHPGFDDTVSPEALLFFDDLTMPVGQVPNLIAALAKMMTVAPAICLLRVADPTGEYHGTGFRINKDLILTNYHVLFPNGKLATKVVANFGFDVDAKGLDLPVASRPGDTGTIMGEEADDWAVVKVENMCPEWPVIALNDASDPKVGDLAYILQHPGGRTKRLGFVRNTITDVNDAVIRYLTDTEQGSSGAPVFDPQGRVIALHHMGGLPVKVVGKPPVAKNEGVRISRVFARLKAAKVLQ
jgi:S1-C subfamily serine protease